MTDNLAGNLSPSLQRKPRGAGGPRRRKKKTGYHKNIEHLYDRLPAHSRAKFANADAVYVHPGFVRPEQQISAGGMSGAYGSASAASGGAYGSGSFARAASRAAAPKKKSAFDASPAEGGPLVGAAGSTLPRLGSGDAFKAKVSQRLAMQASTARRRAQIELATAQGFDATVRAHGKHVRAASVALKDELADCRASQRTQQIAMDGELKLLAGSGAVRDARRERAERVQGVSKIQRQIRGRIARRAVMRKREAVQMFVDKLLGVTQRGAAMKIQRVYRGHMKNMKHAIKRRQMMQARLELQCVTKLQALTRRAHAQRTVHHARLRRQSAMVKWCDARSKIRAIMEDGQFGNTPMIPAGTDTSAYPPQSTHDTLEGRHRISIGGGAELTAAAARATGNVDVAAASGGQPEKQSIRTRKASCLPKRVMPRRAMDDMQQPPALLAERNPLLASAGESEPPVLLYATNLTLCQRAAHAEVWENCGMLEIRGSYYTSSQSFHVRVSEREYRRFGFGNLKQHSLEEKQKLCGLICKDLWNTDMLFDSSAQLIEKVLIEQMPMFGDMKETLKEQISRRVVTRACAAGEKLFSQGDVVGVNDDAIFFVKSGKLDLKIDGLLVKHVDNSDYFGERALIAPGHQREMTVSATSEVELLTLSRYDFTSIIKEHPEYEKNMRVLKASTELLVQAALSNNVAMPVALRSRITDHVMLRVHTKVYKAGELVVQQGDVDDDGMYFVRQGELDVSVDRQVVRSLGELDFFGERALLTPEGVRTATVRTTTHCVLLALSRDAFNQIVKLHPDYALNLETLRTACQQLVAKVISHRMGVTAEMEHDILEFIAARVHLKRYRTGDVVVAEGEDAADGLFFVRAGRLSVTVNGVPKRVLNQANYFGEAALVSTNCSRTATVTALSDCELLNLKELDFKNIVKLHPNYHMHLAALKASCSDLVRDVIAKVVPLSEQAQSSVVEHVVARAKFKSVAASQMLLSEGDDCTEGMFFIRSGKLEVTIGDMVVKTLGPGDYVGERALLSNDGRRTASVRASTTCEMLQLSRADFLHIVDFQPEYQANMTLLSNAVRQLVVKVLPPDISIPKSAEEKIVEFVCSKVSKDAYDPRDRIVTQGEDDDAGMFFVRQGELSVVVGSKRVRTLARGDYFGELALVSEAGVRTATVSCITRCELLGLSRGGFKTVLAEIINALGIGRALKTPGQSRAASCVASPTSSVNVSPASKQRRLNEKLEASKVAQLLAMEERLTYLVEGFGNLDINSRSFRSASAPKRATVSSKGPRKTPLRKTAHFTADTVGGGAPSPTKSARRKTKIRE